MRFLSFLPLFALILVLAAVNEVQAATDTFNASGTWTAPAGVTSVTVEAWAGGGAGGGATGNPAKGGGGAGGQYVRKVVTVTPGNNYAVVVGAGGTGSTGNGAAGGDSTFATNVAVAKGGAGGGGAATNGGDGTAGVGSASGGVGDVVYAGGSGSAGSAGGSCNNGGAGGGGAGSTGAGGAAAGNTGGTGTATGGGDGGAGRNSSGNGNGGTALGGGGGGACAETNTDRSGGDGAAGRVTVTYTPPPVVSSINRASTNPAYADDTVSWTVVFSAAVTGVDAADFVLVPGGGVSGASITSVTGSGTTWTVTASPGGTNAGTLGLNLVDDDSIASGGTPLGGAGAGNGDFTGQVYTITAPFCAPPSNVPAGVTVSCVCDRFGRANLNPSTIFGGDWSLSNSDGIGNPYIHATTGLLRLTENTGSNAKAATVPGIFPAAGNYISVEFLDYAYNGTATGADGIAVTLSDYSIPPVPGGFGGSLGYAQRNDGALPPGFAGGWVGVALDEYGNYQNPTEGRVLGSGFIAQSIGVRGPGSGANGYRWLGGTASNPGGLRIDTANRTSTTPGPGYMYQVIVDSRNSGTGTVNVTVNRDATTKDGSSYASLFGPFNAYTEAAFAVTQGWIAKPVPDYWKISFTGSTGGSTNIHEIGGLRVCAQTVLPPSGGTASGFSAIDEAYPGTPPSNVPAYPNFQSGHIYTKLAGTSFKLWVAALTSTAISTGYSATSNKYVQVKLVDNTDNACGSDSARTCNASCTNKAGVETGATQIATFASGGSTGVANPSPTFTLNSAWKNLIAVMKECQTSTCVSFTATTPACSADSFSVRPTSITSVTSSATQTGTTGTPVFRAGGDNFTLTAIIAGVGSNPGGYTGNLKINNASIQAANPATFAGSISGNFSAATSGTGSSTATGNAFTYSEVGGFRLRTPDFTVPRIPGIYDDTWTALDSDPLKNDCNTGTSAAAYSNTKDANGKYGCNFGIAADTATFGRFTPAYFDVTRTHGCTGASFTYAGVIVGLGSTPVGQPFGVTATARNGAGNVTQNYHSAYGLAKDTTISNAGTATGFFNNTLTAATGTNGFTNGVATTNTIYYSFAAKETAPATLTLRAVDSDLISSSGHTEETTEARSGRIEIQNASGSELVDLAVPMRAQYYTTNGWVTNTADTCTTVTMSFPAFYPNLSSGETCIQDTGSPGASGSSPVTCGPGPGPVAEQFREAGIAGFNGDFNLYLKAPGAGNDGGVDISADLATLPALPWLRYDWDGNGTHDNNPTGRATFGVYRGSPRHIYIRERY